MTRRIGNMNVHKNSISLEDWLAEFPPETQQAIQDAGDCFMARYEAEARRAVRASDLYKQCEGALAQLVVSWYKLGAFLNACTDGLEPEGYQHVLAGSAISESFAQTTLDLWSVCSANPAIMDWIMVSDTDAGNADGEYSQLLLQCVELAKSHLSETESADHVATSPP